MLKNAQMHSMLQTGSSGRKRMRGESRVRKAANANKEHDGVFGHRGAVTVVRRSRSRTSSSRASLGLRRVYRLISQAKGLRMDYERHMLF